MHSSATQILAQRALPATRSKPRWQPYNSIPSASGSISTPRSPTMNIPNPSVASPHPTQASSSQTPAIRSSVLATSIQPPRDLSQRDPSKHKFAAGLIDQAVNTLLEIWRPQDIPNVFQTPSKGSNLLATSSTYTIPSSTPQSSSKTPLTSTLSSAEPTSLSTAAADPDHCLLPMKSFVHEVLRRSRTSASILQAALCYLEAVRPKVPEILKQEQMGIRAHYLPDSTILPATEAELEQEAVLAAMEETMDCGDLPKTIRVTDMDAQSLDVSTFGGQGDDASLSSLIAEASISSSVPAPSLPSPLLCPRRTFLASLILASKFFQDKCYSNRAWAKLSGLPPREIGRCERALGQALEWRLWVGKTSTTPQSTSATPMPSRKVVRSQSEASLFLPTSSTQQFLVQEAGSSLHTSDVPQAKQTPAGHSRTGLRRCSTVPSDVFSTQPPGLCDVSASTTQATPLDQDMVGSSKGLIQHEADASASMSSTSEHAPSPRPPTPQLTYSPSSTESSMGDHTAQMSSFEDNMFPSYDGTQSWLDSSSSHSAVKTASPISLDSAYTYVDGELVLGLVGMPANASGVSIVDPSGGSYGRYLWQEESHYRHVEPAGVH